MSPTTKTPTKKQIMILRRITQSCCKQNLEDQTNNMQLDKEDTQ